MNYVYLIVGLGLLVLGAELLVRGAVVLAALARISPLVVGLTVVAFGTSAPELAVSSVSALKGSSEIALGNVVGSNIFNLLLILGLCAAITPLRVSSQLVKLDVPLMLIASIAVWALAADGRLSRAEGVSLLVVFLLYTGWLVRAGRKQGNDLADPSESPHLISRRRQIPVSLILVVVGFGSLVFGGQMFVEAASSIARSFGVSEILIGLTIVAGGTSLPELATSTVAVAKGQRDIAVGNVVGSNVFNLMLVLATGAAVSPVGVPVTESVLRFDLMVMTLVALLCWPVFWSDAEVTRGEGIGMLVLFVGYTGLTIADEMGWGDASMWKRIYSLVVLPWSFVLVSFLAWRAHRNGSTNFTDREAPDDSDE
ncbi:calcium/sodium antiporter [Roseiconus nitratireducens]|uniref:Calcium/sodium antiporter n=1 Tax=Roseiconus nitratireducens TaxID=2605748 RepID=A0A5M6D3B4_9BACT|nr:calcium/sodium antiporter [Roseiconus nitratireducens]KAA5541823.1 calcium/sodium antiporter [Roseiconus nitratireducens]